MLLRTLPVEARLSRHEGDELVWTMETELLARLLDLSSVTASDRRLRTPVQTPRPPSVGGNGSGRGFRSILAQAAAKGRVRVTG